MRTLEVSLWFCPKFYLDISKKIGARTAKPSKNLRNQRLLGSQKKSSAPTQPATKTERMILASEELLLG